MIEKIYMDEENLAVNPGELSLSMEKLKRFHPSFFGGHKVIKKIFKIDNGDEKKIQVLREHLYYGQIEPAVVLVTRPFLLIAVYSSDIDCVLLLHFSPSLAKKYSLTKGARLLSINTYGKNVHADVIHGPKSAHEWNSFWPIIADFTSDDIEKIEALKEIIPNEIWIKTDELGKNQLEQDYINYRYGDPLLSCQPLKAEENVLKAYLIRKQERQARREERRNARG